MKKNVVSVLLVAAMGAGMLTGCGEKETAETDTVQDVAAETESGSKETAEHEPCEITYYTWAQSADGVYPQNMVDAFEEKYPWITVNFEMGSQSKDEYVQAQKVRFLSGDGMDVTTLYPSTYKEFADAGYLEDITGEDCLNAYSEASLNAVDLDGKIYAVPYAKDAVGIMYNKDMFEENGWEVPTSQEEWLTLCDEIAAKGITPMVNGAKDAWPLAHEVYPFMQELYVNNPDIFDKIDKGETKYTDAEFTECFGKIADYFGSNAVSQDAIGLTFDQANAYFATGKAAMVCHGEWAMGSMKEAEPAFEIGVFQIPYNQPGEAQIGAQEVGQFQTICSSSKHKEAAQLFIDFISSEEGAKYFADSMSNFSAVEGVATPGMEQWQDVLSADSIPFYYDQMYTGASDELFKQLQLLYIGDTTVEDALSSIQAAQDKKE